MTKSNLFKKRATNIQNIQNVLLCLNIKIQIKHLRSDRNSIQMLPKFILIWKIIPKAFDMQKSHQKLIARTLMLNIAICDSLKNLNMND